MDKKIVQKCVTKNGHPLELDKFKWDDTTNTFFSNETGLLVSSLTATFMDCEQSMFTNCEQSTFTNCNDSSFTWCQHSSFAYCDEVVFTDCYDSMFKDCEESMFKDCRESMFKGCRGSTWKIDGTEYNFPPLCLFGSRWLVRVEKPGLLKIGCEEYTFVEWDKNHKKIVKQHDGIGKKVHQEYLGLIEVARLWAKQKGWLVGNINKENEKTMKLPQQYEMRNARATRR